MITGEPGLHENAWNPQSQYSEDNKGTLAHKKRGGAFLNTTLQLDWSYQLISISSLPPHNAKQCSLLQKVVPHISIQESTELSKSHPPTPRQFLLCFSSSQATSSQGQHRNLTVTSKAWTHSTHILQRSLLDEPLMNSRLYSSLIKKRYCNPWKRDEFLQGKRAACYTRRERWGTWVDDGIHMVAILSFPNSPETVLELGFEGQGCPTLVSPSRISQVPGKDSRASWLAYGITSFWHQGI